MLLSLNFVIIYRNLTNGAINMSIPSNYPSAKTVRFQDPAPDNCPRITLPDPDNYSRITLPDPEECLKIDSNHSFENLGPKINPKPKSANLRP